MKLYSERNCVMNLMVLLLTTVLTKVFATGDYFKTHGGLRKEVPNREIHDIVVANEDYFRRTLNANYLYLDDDDDDDDDDGRSVCHIIANSQFCGQTFNSINHRCDIIKLDTDITCPSKGATIEDGISLVGNGHTIQGPHILNADRSDERDFGVELREGGKIKNCIIKGFTVGIDVLDVDIGDISIKNVKVTDCFKGIQVTLENDSQLKMRNVVAIGNTYGADFSTIGTLPKLNQVMLCWNQETDLMTFNDIESNGLVFDTFQYGAYNPNVDLSSYRSAYCDESDYYPIDGVDIEDTCPTHEPSPGDNCPVNDMICEYGEECCCGECSHSFECECDDGEWQCFHTDFCLDPSCDESGDNSSDTCPTREPNPGDNCSVNDMICEYGEECCCGECRHSFECECDDGEWQCMYTDFCLDPSCNESGDDSSDTCPAREPNPGDNCPVNDMICKYGEECCCGECSHSFECECDDGEWQCMYTDFCFDPTCDP